MENKASFKDCFIKWHDFFIVSFHDIFAESDILIRYMWSTWLSTSECIWVCLPNNKIICMCSL